MNQKRDYDSTVARIAGNILSGYPGILLPQTTYDLQVIANRAVIFARMIVEETKRTESRQEEDQP